MMINAPKTTASTIHLMAKPAGPACNLRCEYCFYLEKKAFFPNTAVVASRMTDEVLESYIRQVVAANIKSPAGILFTWQGGEPTLMGIDFFKRAIELEKKYAGNKQFQNTLQTNGTLLDDDWCSFLAKNKFLVGLSLDGPKFIHDNYRRDAAGKPTFKKVFQSLQLLQKHGVEYNVLACISRESSKYPLEIYNFFKESCVEFIQFSPIVERVANNAARQLGLNLCTPPTYPNELQFDNEFANVTSWSVEPEAFGNFYSKIFDEWVRHDVGKIFVMNFEWTLFNSIGGGGAVCYMNDRCGNACIVEHNGDVYACDHFVYPEFKLGNILHNDITSMIESKKQCEWGDHKYDALSQVCKDCEVAFICRGGCPKHRFMPSYDGASNQNYLCAGYKKFYNHTAKYIKAFTKLLEFGLPLECIMDAIDKPLIIKASEKTNRPQITLWIK